MIFTCNTSTLNKAIQTVQRAIISKPSTPIFSGIHFITNEDKLEIQAMDLNMAISCTIDAEIKEAGEIVVSAKHFAELIRKLPGETITIEKNTTNKTIKVSSGKSEFQLLLMNEDDYPKFPEFNGDKTITIEDEKIKELIKKTIFSCSTDEARPLFTGILVEIQDGKITFVGTNTHRLAIKSMAQEANEPMSMIIPAKVLSEISRNLTSEVPQQVQISLLNNQIMIVIDNVVIVSRLIEGKFPDYRQSYTYCISLHSILQRYIIATFENTASNTGHAITNSQRGQRRAIFESITSNAGHTITNSQRGQRRALTESMISNACHAIRDSDRGQRRAIIESRIPNARYAIRNGHRG